MDKPRIWAGFGLYMPHIGFVYQLCGLQVGSFAMLIVYAAYVPHSTASPQHIFIYLLFSDVVDHHLSMLIRSSAADSLYAQSWPYSAPCFGKRNINMFSISICVLTQHKIIKLNSFVIFWWHNEVSLKATVIFKLCEQTICVKILSLD